MTGGLASTGRGGAGNIGDISKSPQVQPQDLETPTLKASTITTGRGGSGNFAKNTDPDETRLRQDVTPVERRPSDSATHVGRGGAANVAKLSPEDAAKSKKHENAVDEDPRKSSDGLTSKGKSWLSKLTGKKD